MTLHDQICKNSKIAKCKLLPLHSSLSSEEQSLIFSKIKQRKIVISTNLAETSITIDDCVFVIEVGKMKEKRFDPTKNMESLGKCQFYLSFRLAIRIHCTVKFNL